MRRLCRPPHPDETRLRVYTTATSTKALACDSSHEPLLKQVCRTHGRTNVPAPLWTSPGFVARDVYSTNYFLQTVEPFITTEPVQLGTPVARRIPRGPPITSIPRSLCSPIRNGPSLRRIPTHAQWEYGAAVPADDGQPQATSSYDRRPTPRDANSNRRQLPRPTATPDLWRFAMIGSSPTHRGMGNRSLGRWRSGVYFYRGESRHEYRCKLHRLHTPLLPERVERRSSGDDKSGGVTVEAATRFLAQAACCDEMSEQGRRGPTLFTELFV